MLELRHLRYFDTVAREASIGHAAAILNISQPPLSRQIHQLETIIGAPLFIRSVKGVELTPVGRVLQADAKSILALADLAVERARRAARGEIGRLDVGIFGTGTFDIAPRLLLKFRQSFPEVEIALHALGMDEQVEALRQRRVTLAFNRLVPQIPDITSRLVMKEPLMVGMSCTNPLAGRAAVELAELSDQPLVLFPNKGHSSYTEFVIQQCRNHGYIPPAIHGAEDAMVGVALVASGFGVCIIPESATHFRFSGVTYLPLLGTPPLMVDISCFYRTEDSSPILREFLRILAAFRAENGLDGES